VAEAERLFGTDGIRGRVPAWPLLVDVVTRLGQAVAEVAREAGYAPLAVIGRDTRRSGSMLEAALAAGLMERGLDVVTLGVLPTPAVALLARHLGAGLGVVISASHNPYPDNGIKFFAGSGFKFPDELERAVEALFPQLAPLPVDVATPVGCYVAPPTRPAEAYLDELVARAGRPQPLQSWHIVLDCAHGATYQVGPELFRRLGARVTVLHAEPDGTNINQDCGSEHPQALREAVLQLHADAGIALDGDGDRVLMVGENGAFLDGDHLLAILARDLHSRGQLRNGVVVGTVMSNLGLERSLASLGVQLERVPVGDRHVARRMVEGDFVLGGESSGHVVLFGEGSTTGDGLYTAMKVLGIAVRRRRPISALTAIRKFPQVTINVPVEGRPALDALPEVQEATRLVEERLDKVRILLRYSGTQPLARVMVEGEEEDEVHWAAECLAEAVRRGVAQSSQ
jgi:phosphoglucosamine mutase